MYVVGAGMSFGYFLGMAEFVSRFLQKPFETVFHKTHLKIFYHIIVTNRSNAA